MIFRILLAIALLGSAVAQSAGSPKETAANRPPAAKAETASADPMESARAMMKSGKYVDAAAAFKLLVEKDPTSEEAQTGLMRSLLHAQKLDDAEAAAAKALTAVPKSASVHATVGDVLLRDGKLGEAEAEYRAALKFNGDSARAWFGVGRIYDIVYMRKHARDAFAKAHSLDPDDEEIFNHWLDTLSYAEQVEALKKHVGDHPTERQSQYLKLLEQVAQKKPFSVAGDIKHTELKLQPYGRELAMVDFVANQEGARPVSKGFALQVKFNDRASAMLLVDTGAEGITIGRRLAEKIGVVRIANSYIGGIGDKGPVEGYLGLVDKIEIGNIEFHNCIVEVSSRNDLVDQAGLLGPGIFKDYLITFDWKAQKMLLAPLPRNPAGDGSDGEPQDRYIAPEMQSFTKAYRFGSDHIFIPVVVSDKVLGTFMLDTGADSNLVTPRIANQVTKSTYEGDYIKGVSGSVSQVLNGDKAILQFAKMRVRSDDIPIINFGGTSRSFGTELGGLIGIRTLVQMKMTIDYRDGLVDLQVYEFKKARE